MAKIESLARAYSRTRWLSSASARVCARACVCRLRCVAVPLLYAARRFGRNQAWKARTHARTMRRTGFLGRAVDDDDVEQVWRVAAAVVVRLSGRCARRFFLFVLFVRASVCILFDSGKVHANGAPVFFFAICMPRNLSAVDRIADHRSLSLSRCLAVSFSL